MIPSLSEQLGKKGYTIVARAPQMDLPQFSDGSWHVVGGSNPTQPELMHHCDLEMIPFILSKGGDVVLYRLSTDGMGQAKPVLSRGGMAGRPPDLATVHSFDPELAESLSELYGRVTKPVPAPEPAKPRFSKLALASVSVGLTLVIGATAYIAMPTRPVPGRWVPDMTNPRDVALAKGATLLVVPSIYNDDTMVIYRNYPGADGKEVRENVGSFKRRDMENWKGDTPDSRLEWRSRF